MAELSELLERVEAATGPDRKLEADVCRFLAGNPTDHWYDFLGTWTSDDKAPTLTASIDAALALVERMLPGCRVELFYGGPIVGHHCHLFRVKDPQAAGKSRDASTLPLAILAALLRALIVPQEAVKE